MVDTEHPAPGKPSSRFDWLTILILIAALANGVLYLYNRNRAHWFGGPEPIPVPVSRPAPSDGFQGTPAPGGVPATPASPSVAAPPGRSILD